MLAVSRKVKVSVHAGVQVKIQALAFSCDEQMLASLGGQDDNSLVRHRHQPPT